jgi:hypothetical protein
MPFMSISSSWNRWRAKKKAKARSDEIDKNIKQESQSFKRQYDVLLMSSYGRILIFLIYNHHLCKFADCIYPLGVTKSEAAASDLIKCMKTIHDGRSSDERAEFTYEKPADFRRVIWKNLLQNSRSVIMAMRSRYLGPTGRSNMVRYVFYNFAISCCM